MEAKTMLERLSGAIEQVLKGHGAAPPAITRKMTAAGLVEHALAEIQKAAKEPPDRATRRLTALGRTVEAAKQAFVDSASEEVEVQVFEEETTAAADETEKETSPVAADAGLGNAAFTSNPEDLHKALTRLGKELAALRGPTQKEDKGAEGKVAKGEDVAWPFDMNTSEFREGVKKAEDAPAWGQDPKGLRAEEV